MLLRSFLFIYLVLKQKDEKMKNVLVILAGSLLATTVKAQMPSPVDSLKISKDVSLDEVVITATKVGKETPVAYSDISKQELSSRNNGQGIPFLISQSPSVIMTSDAGTGIGYSGFRIRGQMRTVSISRSMAYRLMTPSLIPYSGLIWPI